MSIQPAADVPTTSQPENPQAATTSLPVTAVRARELWLSRRKALVSVMFPRYSPLLERLNWNARWTKTVLDCAALPPRFSDRKQLHSFISNAFCDGGAEAIDYLEFGVYRGESLRWWCELNKHPATRCFGFDSFEGLPENWNSRYPKGAFNVSGNLPLIDDPRVSFIAGWFQYSLPKFLSLYQPQNRLIIHNDSDLYSSTLFCLTAMNGVMKPGTIIIFDEFNAVMDEFKALIDYCSAYMRKYRIVAATRGFKQAVIELL